MSLSLVTEPRTNVREIQRLHTKHDALDRQVREEEKRPSPDMLLIARLKREKLKIKDQIAQLGRCLPPIEA